MEDTATATRTQDTNDQSEFIAELQNENQHLREKNDQLKKENTDLKEYKEMAQPLLSDYTRGEQR